MNAEDEPIDSNPSNRTEVAEDFDPLAVLKQREILAAKKKADSDREAREAAILRGDDSSKVPGIISQLFEELPVLYGELYDWDSAKQPEERLKSWGTTAQVLVGPNGEPCIKQSLTRRIFPGLNNFFAPETVETACWSVASTQLKSLGGMWLQILLDYKTGVIYQQSITGFATLIDEKFLLTLSFDEASELLKDVQETRDDIRRRIAHEADMARWEAEHAENEATKLEHAASEVEDAAVINSIS